MSAPAADAPNETINQIGVQLQLDAEGHIIGLAPPPPAVVDSDPADDDDPAPIPDTP